MFHRAKRLNQTASVGVLIDGVRHTAHLRNVSTGGVGMTGPLPMEPGQRVILLLMGARIAAECRWRKGNDFGMLFMPDQDRAELARILARVTQDQGRRMHGFREL